MTDWSLIHMDGIGRPQPDIEFGDVGAYVAFWQIRLGNVLIDGVFGPKTLAATEEFQCADGLTVDGVVGMVTRASSDLALPPPEVEIDIDFTGYPDVAEGDSGQVVMQWQALLNQFSDAELINADGIFGEITDIVTREFQTSAGIPVDGLVDDSTWGAMEMVVLSTLPYIDGESRI